MHPCGEWAWVTCPGVPPIAAPCRGLMRSIVVDRYACQRGPPAFQCHRGARSCLCQLLAVECLSAKGFRDRDQKLPKYDFSKSSDLRRWARDTARNIEKELNRELRRRPVRVPVEVHQPTGVAMWHSAAHPGLAGTMPDQSGGVTFHVHGDGNQIAVANAGDVQQSIIRGLPAVDLAELIRQLRMAVPELGLAEEDAAEFEAAVDKIEQESVKKEPNKGRLRRALATIGDFLKDSGADIAKTLAPLVAVAVQSLTK